MSNRNIISIIVSFLAYTLAQVFLLKNLVLFNSAFCFLYIGFLLLLPLEIGPLLLMLIAFISGISIDIFYDTPGINASAMVLVGFLRPYWLNLITPRGGYEDIRIPSIQNVDAGWFIVYTLPMVFIHHFTLFFLEAGGFSMFFYTILKVILSTIFSFIILILTQYLFYKRQSGYGR